MIRILIADDHRLFRETLGDLLGAREGMEITALCQDSDETIETIQAEQPDLVLLDIKMKPLSGIAITQKIKTFAASKIIGLSMYSLTSYATNMIRAGAHGYITKNSALDEIITGIHTVMRGEKYICREIKDLIVQEEMEPELRAPHIGLLTTREIEVVQLISKGFSSKEIALQLQVTYKTIEIHRHHMLQKLQLKNTSELINYLHTQVPDFL